MTTPEQQARDMVDSAVLIGDFGALVKLIEERDRLRENETLFRRLLADRSGLQFVSRDDGGLQAEANGIDFDFLRDTPQDLQRKFHSLVVSRLTSSGPNAGRVKPLQETTELDRLRAGIDAALVEIDDEHKRSIAVAQVGDDTVSNHWTALALGLQQAARIVRKHTGVTP